MTSEMTWELFTHILGMKFMHYALLAAVLAGSGWGVMPAFLAHADLQAGRLVPLLPDVRLPPFGMVYAVYGERRLPLRTRLFLDLLQDSIGAPPVWAREGR